MTMPATTTIDIEDPDAEPGGRVTLPYARGVDLVFDAIGGAPRSITVDHRTAAPTATAPLLDAATDDLGPGSARITADDLPSASATTWSRLGRLAILIDLEHRMPMLPSLRPWWWCDAARRAAGLGSPQLAHACLRRGASALAGLRRADLVELTSDAVEAAIATIADIRATVDRLGIDLPGFALAWESVARGLELPRSDDRIRQAHREVERSRRSHPGADMAEAVEVAIDPSLVDTREIDPRVPVVVARDAAGWKVAAPLHAAAWRSGDLPPLDLVTTDGDAIHLNLDPTPTSADVAIFHATPPLDRDKSTVRLRSINADHDDSGGVDLAMWTARRNAHLARMRDRSHGSPFLVEVMVGCLGVPAD